MATVLLSADKDDLQNGVTEAVGGSIASFVELQFADTVENWQVIRCLEAFKQYLLNRPGTL